MHTDLFTSSLNACSFSLPFYVAITVRNSRSISFYTYIANSRSVPLCLHWNTVHHSVQLQKRRASTVNYSVNNFSPSPQAQPNLQSHRWVHRWCYHQLHCCCCCCCCRCRHGRELVLRIKTGAPFYCRSEFVHFSVGRPIKYYRFAFTRLLFLLQNQWGNRITRRWCETIS